MIHFPLDENDADFKMQVLLAKSFLQAKLTYLTSKNNSIKEVKVPLLNRSMET